MGARACVAPGRLTDGRNEAGKSCGKTRLSNRNFSPYKDQANRSSLAGRPISMTIRDLARHGIADHLF